VLQLGLLLLKLLDALGGGLRDVGSERANPLERRHLGLRVSMRLSGEVSRRRLAFSTRSKYIPSGWKWEFVRRMALARAGEAALVVEPKAAVAVSLSPTEHLVVMSR